MDELRSQIWDYLIQRGEPVSVDDLTRHFDRDRAAICAAVDHEWFRLSGDAVGIAYMSSPTRVSQARDSE